MTATDDVLKNNAQYAEGFDKADLPLPPALNMAVVACMDARLDTHKLLGIQEGDAHVIRNAGGVVTDDVIRSLVISQRLLGTREVVLIHHTDCGMLTFRDDDVKDAILADTGLRPSFAMEAFGNLEGDVRQSIARIKASPFVPAKDQIRASSTTAQPGGSTKSPRFGWPRLSHMPRPSLHSSTYQPARECSRAGLIYYGKDHLPSQPLRVLRPTEGLATPSNSGGVGGAWP